MEYRKKYDTSQFVRDSRELGIILSDTQISQFIIYYEMLTEWNTHMNLTAITEYDDVMKKHFIDSISLCRAFDVFNKVSCIDVGTGAGFPGLALKIAYPELRITLMDSLNKRIQFLDAVIEKLTLTEIETIHGRAEDCARCDKYREKFDLCVSRAVANLSTLSEYCIPFVREGGSFISYKSEKITTEIEAAENAISILGGEVIKQVEFMLPYSDIYRNLLVIEKRRKTPERYPRKAGLPTKQPII